MKRIMALILAIAMIVGVIPVALATDAASADSYTYVFSNAAHTETASYNTSVALFENDGYQGLHDINGTVSSQSAPWGYVAQSFPNNALTVGTDNTGIRLSYTKPGATISFNPEMSSDVTALCVELTVGAAGEYTPTIETQSFANLAAPIVEFYLVPKNDVAQITNANLSSVVKGLDAKYRIGVADTLDGGVAGAYEKTFRKLSLSAENYYLIAVPNGENANNVQNKIYYFVIASLVLKKEPVVKYDYILTTDQTSGGIDVDTDGDGVDIGMPVDTTPPADAVAAGNSEIGIWKHSNVYKLYNAAIPRFMGDYTYVNTNNSANWAYYKYNNPASAYIDNNGAYMTTKGYPGGSTYATAGNGYFVLKLQVGQADTYDLSFIHNDIGDYEGQVYFSFFPVSGNSLDVATITANKVGSSFNLLSIEATDGEQSVGKVTASSSGDYYLVVFFDDTQPGYAGGFQGVQIKSLHLEGTKSASLSATQPGDEYVNVSPDNATAKVTGATTYEEVNASSVTVDGSAVNADITKTTSSVSAPQLAGENNKYEFLYWTKGIGKERKIVSQSTTHTFDATPGNNIFFAVYRDTTADSVSKATFYNANGDILGTADVTDGEVTTLPLDKVSLPGYGTANGWKLAGDDTVYGASTAVSVTDDALFVASYEEADNTIDISVEDDVTIVIEDGEKTTASYGDKVTVTAPLRRDNTKLFNYWKKGDEIVSFDREYSFCAWEICTLTAVYSDYVPLADTVRKIILGTVKTNGETTVIAEFIGFDDAVERGIAFGITDTPASYQSINRVVMNRKDLNHLAAIDDIGAGYVGYAIDKDGNVYYSK